MAKAGTGMGGQTTGHQTAGPLNEMDESALDSEIQGRNKLQGSDQRRTRNERQSMPGETSETEGVVESFEKMDPRKRAGKSPL